MLAGEMPPFAKIADQRRVDPPADSMFRCRVAFFDQSQLDFVRDVEPLPEAGESAHIVRIEASQARGRRGSHRLSGVAAEDELSDIHAPEAMIFHPRADSLGYRAEILADDRGLVAMGL